MNAETPQYPTSYTFEDFRLEMLNALKENRDTDEDIEEVMHNIEEIFKSGKYRLDEEDDFTNEQIRRAEADVKLEATLDYINSQPLKEAFGTENEQ